METHLLCDLRLEERFTWTNEIPIHVVLSTDRFLSFSQLREVVAVYSQNAVYVDGAIQYGAWNKLTFSTIVKEFRLSDFFRGRKVRCDELYHGAIITSLPVSLDDLFLDLNFVVVKILYDTFTYDDIVIKYGDIFRTKPISITFATESKTSAPIDQNEDFFDLTFSARPETTTPSSGVGRLTTNQGPLEYPSTVRGLTVTRDRAPPRLIAEEPEPEESPSKSIRWFDQYVHEKRVTDYSRTRNIHVLWYELSFYVNFHINYRKMEYTSTTNLSITDYHDKFDRYLSTVGTRVFSVIADAILRCNKKLPQKFDCNFRVNYDCSRALPFMHIAREIWILNLTINSCIIKAIMNRLYKSRNLNRVQLGKNEFWGDFIDCSRTSVIFGELVTIECDASTRLLSTRRKNQTRPWEQYPDCCALYVNDALLMYWVLPGGFCVSSQLTVDKEDVDVFDWSFKLP